MLPLGGKMIILDFDDQMLVLHTHMAASAFCDTNRERGPSLRTLVHCDDRLSHMSVCLVCYCERVLRRQSRRVLFRQFLSWHCDRVLQLFDKLLKDGTIGCSPWNSSHKYSTISLRY
jgi:hypothetical protein